MTLAQNAPLVLLGVPLGAHATVLVALKLATVFVHSNVRVPVGPLRFVVATPRFHHRHHQRGGAVANFASFLPLIDVLFGSYSDEPDARASASSASCRTASSACCWRRFDGPAEPRRLTRP